MTWKRHILIVTYRGAARILHRGIYSDWPTREQHWTRDGDCCLWYPSEHRLVVGEIAWLWLQEKVCESLWSRGHCAASRGTEPSERGKQLVIVVKVSSVLMCLLCYSDNLIFCYLCYTLVMFCVLWCMCQSSRANMLKVLRRMYSVVICCADFTVCWAFLTVTILRTGLIQLCRWSTLLVRQIAYNKACLKTILSPESKILICCWSVIFSVDDYTVFV